MNRRPLRPISADDIETYKRDGAVCLRQVFDRDWIDALLPVAKRIVIDKEDFGLLPHAQGRYMSRKIPIFRELALNSPLGEACGRVMESDQIRFYYDEFFAKEPQSTAKTVWHSDRCGWPVVGTMVPSFWMPLTPIVKANSLEVIAGTHRQDILYWNMSPNARKMVKPEGRPNIPDGDEVRSNPDYTFLSWDIEPGDALLVHPWTLHYSSGNPTDDWRIAISARVFGDDIRWEPRPECVNLAGVSFDEMILGEKPLGDLFPLIWSTSGEREVGNFPTGFSTSWTPEVRARIIAATAAAPSYEADVAQRGGASRLVESASAS